MIHKKDAKKTADKFGINVIRTLTDVNSIIYCVSSLGLYETELYIAKGCGIRILNSLIDRGFYARLGEFNEEFSYSILYVSWDF